MNLTSIEQMETDFLTATDVASVLGVHPQRLRDQARLDSSALGFPVTIIGSKVLIPRIAFINYTKGE